MINRYYVCDACDYHLVVQQELHDEKRRKKCPNCKKNKLYQDLTGQHTFVYQEPKTIGHLAARNTEQAGKYEIQSKQRQMDADRNKSKLELAKKSGIVAEDATELPEAPKPWFNPTGADLNKELKTVLSSPEKAQKYVMTGEK